MKKYQQGFSAIEVVLVLVVVGLVGAVGWLVYDRQQNTETETNDEANSQQEQQTEQDITTKTPSYSLPENWTETACDSVDSKATLASPSDDVALDCDDRTNVILISLYDGGTEGCLSDSEVVQVAQDKPISGYLCEEIALGAVKVVKETGNYGGGPLISYSFIDKPLIITYYSNESGELVNSDDVDMTVKSVAF